MATKNAINVDMICNALSTHIAVLRRRERAEKNGEIRALIIKDIDAHNAQIALVRDGQLGLTS